VGQGSDPRLRPLVEEIGREDHRVRYLYLRDRGLSRARNAGMAASTGDIIAMTDDDCEADSEWLSTLAHYFKTEPDVGLVGGSLLKPEHTSGPFVTCPSLTPEEALYDPGSMGRRAPRGWDWIGGNFAARRHVFEAVGPFDVYLGAGSLFPSAEDTDYKLRLEARGVVMRSTPRAVVYHTYGVRQGVVAGLRHSQNYARGNGALAGKLSLSGDPRGREWLRSATRESTTDWARERKLHRLPLSLLRMRHFSRAYRQCVSEFRVDPSTDLLYPVDSSAS
jgi:GT2 family glycosyltransferase